MATTLKELMTRALAYADYPKDSLDADQKTQLIVDINDGLTELWNTLVDAQLDLILKTATITLVSGTDQYDLPSDFYKSVKVWIVVNGRRYKLKRFHLDEVDGYPRPISAGTIELWYAPAMVPLKAATSTVSSLIPNRWENYAAAFAAGRLLAMEESDTSQVDAIRDRIVEQVRQYQGPRDEGVPDSIGDISMRWESAYILRDFIMREVRYRILGSKISFIECEQGGV